MISLSEMTKNVEKFTHDNSPIVLTAVGTVGVVTTGVLAAKGGMKAADILREAESSLDVDAVTFEKPELTVQDKALKTWKCYIPAVSSGALTCVAVIGSSQISTRRAAAMAAAYSISEKRLNDFRARVSDTVGEKKTEEISAAVLTDKVEKSYSPDSVIVMEGDQLCFDELSGRYFRSSVENVKFAMNKVNFMINNDGYASLSDFYDALGLDRTGLSEELGWTSNELLDINFTTVMTPDSKPAICLDYKTRPVRNYFRLG